MLNSSASSEGPGETARPRSLARAVAALIQTSMEVDEYSDKILDFLSHMIAECPSLNSDYITHNKIIVQKYHDLAYFITYFRLASDLETFILSMCHSIFILMALKHLTRSG